jgi:hypothetical protein
MSNEDHEMDRRQWHLDKSISLSHILTTGAIIVSALAFAFNIQGQIAVLQANMATQTQAMTQIIDTQRRTDARQDAELDTIKRQAREDYNALGAKMDRLIEYNKRAVGGQ